MTHALTHIIVASHNLGKVREIRDLLVPFGVDVKSALDIDLPEPEETEDSFAGNARLKAEAAAKATGLPSLSDDSGLEVDALHGAPGIYAARWAETPEQSGRDFGMAMEKVWTRMHNTDDTPVKTARFVCALCLAWPNGEFEVFEGTVDGNIVWPPRGQNGFGYDPIFQALGDELTFGELDPEVKHAKSHRADAFKKFVKRYFPDASH